MSEEALEGVAFTPIPARQSTRSFNHDTVVILSVWLFFFPHKALKLSPVPTGTLKKNSQCRVFPHDFSAFDHGPYNTAGSRRGFYKIRQHYAILLRKRYSDAPLRLLRGEFPPLALGISGASLHCLESLGYAAALGAPAQLVVDALAYLHHSFAPNFLTIPRYGIKLE